MFYVHPYLGKITNLTNIFQMGWNHQHGKFATGNIWNLLLQKKLLDSFGLVRWLFFRPVVTGKGQKFLVVKYDFSSQTPLKSHQYVYLLSFRLDNIWSNSKLPNIWYVLWQFLTYPQTNHSNLFKPVRACSSPTLGTRKRNRSYPYPFKTRSKAVQNPFGFSSDFPLSALWNFMNLKVVEKYCLGNIRTAVQIPVLPRKKDEIQQIVGNPGLRLLFLDYLLSR